MNRVFLAAFLALTPFAPALAQQPTIQQQFDAATAAIDAEQWEEALRQLDALEARVTSPRSLAIVRVRKASALNRLGRLEESTDALRLGLPQLPEDDRSLDADRFLGLVALGEIAELSLDYGEALRHYRAARSVPVPTGLRFRVYRGLIQTEMFENAASALATVDEALALAQSEATGPQHEGQLRTMRGRVLLNMGRFTEARDELRGAMERLGGLTNRVNLADIVARSDLAIAAMLAGRPEDARRYLAYTGAGQFESSVSPSNGRMEPPRCGNGLEPSDLAIVEFSIHDDGSVGHATPIYSSRQGPIAIAFAEAARRWSWPPDTFNEIPPLFRSAMRVEVRCTLRDPEPDGYLGRYEPLVAAWLDAHGIIAREAEAARPPSSATQLRQELARREAITGPQSATLLPVLIELARHASVDAVETEGYLRRAIPIAATEQAPPAIIGDLAVALAFNVHQAARGRSGRRDRVDFAPVLGLPVVRDDPRATATVRLAWAKDLFQHNEDEDAARILDQVRQTPGIAGDDRITSDALALEAAIAAARGDMQAARAAYQAMGADARPCAIPRRTRRTGVSTTDFPQEAQRWGFEGWVNLEADVSPNGEVEQQRTVTSYPPFVFDESAERVVSRFRLEPVYVPDGVTCPALRQGVKFRIAPY